MKAHLKRISAPKSWPIPRKGSKFITRPNPGRAYEYSIPVNIAFKLLDLADTARETRYILNNHEVLLNNKKVTSYRAPFGLLDVLYIPALKQAFTLLINDKGKLFIKDISKDNFKQTIGKVINKTSLKGGKTQLNLFNGINLLAENMDIKVGDSVVYEIGDKKIKEILPLREGVVVYIIAGRFTGYVGKVIEIKESMLVFESNGQTFQTLKNYAFVIGKDKPLIDLE